VNAATRERPSNARRLLALADWLFGARRDNGIVLLLISLVQIAVAITVYLTGGTQYVYLQFAYIPVAVAGLVFGTRWGTAFGLFTGLLLLGPLMPLDTFANIAQPTLGWVIRMAFLCLQGAAAGFVGDLLKRRVKVLEVVADELALTYGRVLRSLVKLIGERDDETADHSERVAYNAIQMGKALGLKGTALETLYWAAVLHDLGKIGIPERILNHPGPLSDADRTEMQRHVEIGERVILEASVEFKPIAEIVAAHHERWDGQGYPRGVRGEAIPLAGRILTVLDVFEALTSKRPYRAPMSPDAALEIVRGDSGTRFDPRIVDAFVTLLEDRQLALSDITETKAEQLHDRYNSGALLLSRIRGVRL
jgi:HD-GYP domain-containing protein (c-di-GMP phosphodiesterase class II)